MKDFDTNKQLQLFLVIKVSGFLSIMRSGISGLKSYFNIITKGAILAVL